MNLKYRHITGIALLLYGLLGLVSCTSESLELPREEKDDYNIFLTFQAAVAGVSTRADGSVADDGHVETLRIVIVSHEKEEGATWKVEHNEQVSLTTPLPHEYTFKVAPNSQKRIYLIANEDGLANTNGTRLDFSDDKFIPDATTGNVAVDDYVFDVSNSGRPYTPSALPMTGLYEFEVPPLDEIQNGEFKGPGTLYLVRAATKFTFEFTNQSTQRDITVTGIDIKEVITDRMYLMPHVNKNENDKYWVVKETNTKQYSLEELGEKDWDAYWDNAETDSEGNTRWLTNYKVPASVTKGTASIPLSDPIEIPSGEPVDIPKVIYLPESKTLKNPDDNRYHLQEYSITVYTEEGEETKEYTATLPHLASLFRNTHVVVGAIFTDQDHTIDWVVDVIPFTSVELTPDYGLEREEFTGYIIGKDKEGKDCWYDGNYYDPATAVPLYLGPKDNPGEFVTINNKEYLLVYANNERTAEKLDHFFEKETQKKYLLTPEGITGYKAVEDKPNPWLAFYLNDLQQRVWLDSGGDPNGNADDQAIYKVLLEVGLNLKCCRILYEWDRLNWNQVRWDKMSNIYPKYWFDILGNRYPWSEGDTKEKREAKLGEWAQYLE